MRKLLIVGMVLLMAGCATGGGGGATAPTVDVTGTWNGSFVPTGGAGAPIEFVAVLEQKGASVTGNMSGGRYTGPIVGTVSGNQFSWKQAIGSGSGDLVW